MIDTIDDRRDKHDIGNRLFANSCSCGAETAQNDIFCPACRIEHEALLIKCFSCRTESVAVGVLCVACVSTGEYCANCGETHSAQHCPEIWRALRDQPIPYAMAAAALGLAA